MKLEEFKLMSDALVRSISRVYVGDDLVVRKMLCAALANGHVLFEDNPGLGKTLLAKTFARNAGCEWGRIQFTPDIMPADILGTRVWRSKTSEFVLERGPVFTNILLADEITRSPPKTQAALLEAMEERQVTIEGTTLKLPRPFFVIATANPIEQEGIFRLPESQLDRFMLKLSAGYMPTVQMESEILRRRIRWKADSPADDIVAQSMARDSFVEMQEVLENDIYVDGKVLDYISEIVRATREHKAVEVGASPRGGIALLKLSRALAAMSGRDFVTPDDVKMLAPEALGHRIILDTEHQLTGSVTPHSVVKEVLESVPVPGLSERKVGGTGDSGLGAS